MAKRSPTRAKAIAKSKQTTSLILNREPVTDAVLTRLNGLKHLRELHVVDASLITATGIESIERLSRLEWLNLDHVAAGDVWLSALPNLKVLCGLQVTHSKVTCAGLESLIGLKKLKYLELDRIDDDALRVVAKIKSLRTLRICDALVTNDGIQSLKSKRLRTLCLKGTLVTQEAVAQLRKALPNCKIKWSPGMRERSWAAQERSLQASRPRILKVVASSKPVSAKNVADGQTVVCLPLRSNRSSRCVRIVAAQFKAQQPEWFHLLDW